MQCVYVNLISDHGLLQSHGLLRYNELRGTEGFIRDIRWLATFESLRKRKMCISLASSCKFDILRIYDILRKNIKYIKYKHY